MIPYDHWQPLRLQTLSGVLTQAPFRWGLAGGYGVEQFVGRAYRTHRDIDVVVLRTEQHLLQRHLAGWHLYVADPPGHLRPWLEGEYLPKGLHDIWAHRGGQQAWELQVMLQEANEEQWFYRRDARIAGPVATLFDGYKGWPCMQIEVQLLYKSKQPRQKDQHDFEMCLPLLDEACKGRLCRYLRQAYPDGHRWLARIENA